MLDEVTKQRVLERLDKSRVYQLVDDERKVMLKNALLGSSESKLPVLLAMLDEDDAKLVAMEEEIAKAEERKKNFKKDLELKIAEDKQHSDELADALIADLEQTEAQPINKPATAPIKKKWFGLF
jgi:hypothetical protein